MFTLLLGWSLLLIMHGAHGSQRDQASKEFLEAKRRFDRVKHHPVEEPAPPPRSSEAAGDQVTFKARDGTIRTMSREDMMRQMEESQREMPRVDDEGKLSKSKEGKATIEELHSKDPQLASIIEAGKYALTRLQEQGVALGTLKGLTTVDDEGQQVTAHDAEVLKLLLTVEDFKGGGIKKYQVELHAKEGRAYLARAFSISHIDEQKSEISLGPMTEKLQGPRWAPGGTVNKSTRTRVGQALFVVAALMLLAGVVLLGKSSSQPTTNRGKLE